MSTGEILTRWRVAERIERVGHVGLTVGDETQYVLRLRQPASGDEMLVTISAEQFARAQCGDDVEMRLALSRPVPMSKPEPPPGKVRLEKRPPPLPVPRPSTEPGTLIMNGPHDTKPKDPQ